MKTEQPILTTSITASGALTKQTFIGFGGALCAAAAKALGVCAASTASGEQAPVITDGIAQVIAGAAVAVGAAVEADSSGYAVTKSAGVINGYALDAADASGDVIRVHLI